MKKLRPISIFAVVIAVICVAAVLNTSQQASSQANEIGMTSNFQGRITQRIPSASQRPSGLISLWKADGNANDSAGSNEGTLMNGASIVSGIKGQSFSFNGTDGFVNVPDSPSLDAISTGVTIEAWINPLAPLAPPLGGGAGRGAIFAHREPNVSEAFELDVRADGRLSIVVKTSTSPGASGTSFVSTNPVIQFNNQWKHVAATIDANTGQALGYVNGQPISMDADQAPALNGQFPNVSDTYIGRRQDITVAEGTPAGAAHYRGLIDELALYGRALTPSEILSIFDSSNNSCLQAPNNMVAWWRGEGNVNDSSGNNNGSLVNGASIVSGFVGQGFSLNGNSQYVEIPHSDALNPTTALTVEAWVKLSEMPPASATNGWDVITKDNPSAGPYVLRVKNDGSALFAVNFGAGWHHLPSTPGIITPGNFYHIAGTFSAADQQYCVFVNGVATCTQIQGQLVLNSNNVRLGSDLFNSTFFKGVIDEPTIYNRALSPSEIQLIHAAGSAGKCAVGCADAAPQNVFEDTSLVAAYPGDLGTKTPVILIHGIHGNRSGGIDDATTPYLHYFRNLILYLNDNGGQAFNKEYKTYKFHYESDKHSAAEISKALRDRIDNEFPGRQVVLVAHSMGGIVARQYMLQSSADPALACAPSGARVDKLITLATPHHGTYGANGLARLNRFSLFNLARAAAAFAASDVAYWSRSRCFACAHNLQNPNRGTVLWDNFDNRFSPVLLQQFPAEIPTDLPSATLFNSKIIAYYGDISLNDSNWTPSTFDPLGIPSTLAYGEGNLDDIQLAGSAYLIEAANRGSFSISNALEPKNDGLVPIESARFDGANLMTNGRIYCSGYNHSKMLNGSDKLCDDGNNLFKSVRNRIIGKVVISSALLVGPDRAGLGNQVYGLALSEGEKPNTQIEVELSNLGDEPLQITSLILIGDNANQFKIVNAPATPFTVPAASSVRVKVAFNPTSAGLKTAQLRAENSSSNSVVIVNLSATGLPAACDLNLSPSSRFMPTEGGNGQVAIGDISCPWTVTAIDDWIHPAKGDGLVTFSVDANPSNEVRYGTIIVSVYGRSYLYSISQDAANSTCWLSLSSDQSVGPIEGGAGNFYLTTSNACSWNIQSDSAWLMPTAASIQGSGKVAYTIAANYGAARTATITLQNGETTAQFQVHQLKGKSTPFNFDDEQKADVSVWRPSSGMWYIRQIGGGFTEKQWGAEEDRIAPADFDGDGKTDFAVYRPSSGNWYIWNSQSSTMTAQQWGDVSDVLVPADYDNDGKANIAVWRPSDGNWYVRDSIGGYTATQWGALGDKPVPADYDGNGKVNIAVWRPSSGMWYTLNDSAPGFTSTQWGDSNDKLVPADYDGDGKANIAVWRPSSGMWYILQIGGGFTSTQWGDANDLPVPADYDGNSKTNISVYRPSTGMWYTLNDSAPGFTSTQWGAVGDIPTPNVWVR